MKKKNPLPMIGIFGGFTLIILAIILQGNIRMFWSLSSMIITIVGSFMALLGSFPVSYLKNIPVIVKQTMVPSAADDRKGLVELFTNLAKKARTEGLLALEDELEEVEDQFLVRGIQMVIDGIEPENIKDILEFEIFSTQNRHSYGHEIFKKWGELAPAYGMIGTIIGLIIMLADLSDAQAIGSGMATALITTFYGALFANVVCAPIANNLEGQTNEEVLTKEMIIEGILSIQAGVNPRIVAEKLKTYLAPSEKMPEEDKKKVS